MKRSNTNQSTSIKNNPLKKAWAAVSVLLLVSTQAAVGCNGAAGYIGDPGEKREHSRNLELMLDIAGDEDLPVVLTSQLVNDDWISANTFINGIEYSFDYTPNGTFRIVDSGANQLELVINGDVISGSQFVDGNTVNFADATQFTAGGVGENAARLWTLTQTLEPLHMALMENRLSGGNVGTNIEPIWGWIIIAVVMIVTVVVENCTGTENTCNGATPVTCNCPKDPTRTIVLQDPCGCGVSACDMCFSNSCADECEDVDLCRGVECPVPKPL